MIAYSHGEYMSNEAYHAAPGISSSGLKLILRSPAHYWAAYLDPQRERPESTPAMQLGTMIHSATLEPATLGAGYYVLPEGLDRRTTAGKATYAAALLEAAGRILVSADDYRLAAAIADAVNTHHTAGVLLRGALMDQSYFADAPSCVACKARPDALSIIGGIPVCADLKSAEDARPEAFARACVNYGYDLSAAFYIDVVQWAGQPRPESFFFIVVEKELPFAVMVYEASEEFLRAGRDKYQRALATYVKCHQAQDWGSYTEDVQLLDLPAWAKTDFN